ncbi:hypothetical protein SAY86_011520 [Trapa natans]|uniref:Transmembrane protein n=1 Tax=Trapa natans TaxID=22666 RepID=A0AAN7LX72_TRANT|nr:hypothetical protein SAY86_011520 [Trapa natans]
MASAAELTLPYKNSCSCGFSHLRLKALWAIVGLVGYLLKLVLAFIVHFIGDHFTSTTRFIETALYTIREFYSSIFSYVPVPELTAVVIYSSVVIAIAKAVVLDAVESQPYTLTLSGVVGSALAAIGEPWVRALVVTTFLALAIHHHWRKVSEGKAPGDVIMVRRLPLPLLGVALAIGVRLAAKWAVYQHLTWMII